MWIVFILHPPDVIHIVGHNGQITGCTQGVTQHLGSGTRCSKNNNGLDRFGHRGVHGVNFGFELTGPARMNQAALFGRLRNSPRNSGDMSGNCVELLSRMRTSRARLSLASCC